MTSSFKQKVISIVKAIPNGCVASYGQVALYVGFPRGARQVGWILNGLERKLLVPWWRVVNNKGQITIKGSVYTPLDQKMHLVSEGIKVEKDFSFNIKKHRWHPTEKEIQKFELDEDYTKMLIKKGV